MQFKWKTDLVAFLNEYINEANPKQATRKFVITRSYGNKSTLNTSGQPRVRTVRLCGNSARIEDRDMDELIGICKGVLADRKVVLQEAEFLKQWLDANWHVATIWPANTLYQRIEEMLVDDILDQEEQKELFELLHQFTGGDIPKQAASMTTKLPFDEPQPQLTFKDRLYCFTGNLAYGSRKQCASEVTSRGGTVKNSITQETNYLVVGAFGNIEWIHSTHGRKIEKAIDMRKSGYYSIAIISEQHWTDSLWTDS